MRRTFAILLSAVLGASQMPARAAAPTFHPDLVMRNNDLAAWHTLGAASWSAAQGVLTGMPGRGDSWLVLNDSYQDINFFSEFRCSTGCTTGVLFRAQRTAEGGLRGTYVALGETNLPAYSVVIDAQGKFLQKIPLRRGGALDRVAPPPPPTPPAAPAPRAGGGGQARPTVRLPFQPRDTSYKAGEWNSLEVFFDANIIRALLNTGRENGAATEEGYGAVALYSGGTGDVQFRGVALGDMGVKVRLPDVVSRDFRKQTLNEFYYSWGTAAADFNHDGSLDVISGPYIYYGPDYTKSREIWLAKASNPTTDFATDSTMEFSADFTGDGWPDVVTVHFGGGPNAFLYVNPKGEKRRWDRFPVLSGVQSEIAVLRDVDGDGKPELVYSGDGTVRYAKPDPANPTGQWVTHDVSERGYGASHGIGVGDVNGDGKLDILDPYGWWENPGAGATQAPWAYHAERFAGQLRGGAGGSVIAVYDVNGDGRNDVVTSLAAHGFGLSWFEQKRDSSGKISFEEHLVMGDFSTKNAGDVLFSELHGSTFADVDGDGLTDFIVGKRYFSHLDTNLDPDPRGAPVLYWYKTVHDPKVPGGGKLVPMLIDNRSGVGSDVLAMDLNQDGAMDVITSTRFGTYIYWGKTARVKKASASR